MSKCLHKANVCWSLALADHTPHTLTQPVTNFALVTRAVHTHLLYLSLSRKKKKWQFWVVDSYLMSNESKEKIPSGLSANFFGTSYGSTKSFEDD
jgi:hypothetical protein